MSGIDYSDAARTYDDTRTCDELVIGNMTWRFDFAAGKRVLDFGCGTGNYLERLSRRFDCELFGLEPSAEMRVRARAKNPSLPIAEGDHLRLPYDAGFFELVYMTDVIHHVPSLPELFASLARVLKPGGLVCVVTESWGQIASRWYNAYFPSLERNEKARYPDIGTIAERAAPRGLGLLAVDEIDHPGPHVVTEPFLAMVREKNYSMFRILDEEEFEAGYAALTVDLGRSFVSPGAGESLVWLEKGA
jgi:SAM-dependent methyltransferase